MTADTRTALLDTAEALLRRHGFDGFSYADLAADVGIRKASIHYHFPTKADLSVALITRYREAMAQFCAAAGQDSTSAADALRQMLARYRSALEDGACLCLCVALITGRDTLSPPAIGEITAYRGMLSDWVTAQFARAQADGSVRGVGDPGAEAAATLALLEGAQLSARAARDVSVFDAATALLRGRLAG